MIEHLAPPAAIIRLGMDLNHTAPTLPTEHFGGGLYTEEHIMKKRELEWLSALVKSETPPTVVLCTNFSPVIARPERRARDAYLGPLVQQHDTVRNIGSVETVALLPARMGHLAEEERTVINRLRGFTHLILRENGEPTGRLSDRGTAVLGQILACAGLPYTSDSHGFR